VQERRKNRESPCRHEEAISTRRFVSVSLDDATDKGALEHARAFLKRQKAAFENYLMDDNVTDAFEKPTC
jgi:hypothetical protein